MLSLYNMSLLYYNWTKLPHAWVHKIYEYFCLKGLLPRGVRGWFIAQMVCEEYYMTSDYVFMFQVCAVFQKSGF